MTNYIYRNDAVKEEMDKPTTRGQVDRYLSHMLAWIGMGYEFTEAQSDKLLMLYEVVKGNDA